MEKGRNIENKKSFYFHPSVKSNCFQYFAPIIFPLLSNLGADAYILRFILHTSFSHNDIFWKPIYKEDNIENIIYYNKHT